MSFVEQVMAATSLHPLDIRMKVLETERQVLLLQSSPTLQGLLKKGL